MLFKGPVNAGTNARGNATTSNGVDGLALARNLLQGEDPAANRLTVSPLFWGEWAPERGENGGLSQYKMRK